MIRIAYHGHIHASTLPFLNIYMHIGTILGFQAVSLCFDKIKHAKQHVVITHGPKQDLHIESFWLSRPFLEQMLQCYKSHFILNKGGSQVSMDIKIVEATPP